MADYSGFEEQRIKHLELIQAVIGRLGNDSFLVKGWAVTVAGAFFAFAVNSDKWGLALAGLLPTVFFWYLDTYFLRSERLFRDLYEQVRADSDDIEPFSMNATAPSYVAGVARGPSPEAASFWKTAWRPTLRIFYGALIAASLVVAVLVFIN